MDKLSGTARERRSQRATAHEMRRVERRLKAHRSDGRVVEVEQCGFYLSPHEVFVGDIEINLPAPTSRQELLEIRPDVVEIFQQEGPTVPVLRDAPYQFDEQEWLTSLLLTDPRSFSPATSSRQGAIEK